MVAVVVIVMLTARRVAITAVFQLAQYIGSLFELLEHLLAAEALILHPFHALFLDFEELAVQSVALTFRLTHHLLLLVQICRWDGSKIAFKSVFQKFLLGLRLCKLEGITQCLRWMLLSSDLL